jgi:hypothetical protein
MKIGEPTGELTHCDGGTFEAECTNMVRVRHDPYSTAQIALCSPCNFGGGEVYGPLDEPYVEDEHDGTAECCAVCKHQVELDDLAFERYAAECDAAHEDELERLAQERPPTLWARARYWLARLRVYNRPGR